MSSEKFVAFVDPSKLEFKIINDDDLSSSTMLESMDSSSAMLSSSSSYGSMEEGFSSESILEQYLTLSNPYDSVLSFKIECNKPAHYSLKIPAGSIEPKTEFKIKLKMKPAFLNDIRKRGRKNQAMVEEVEQYEDAFQVKFIRTSDSKETSKIIKSNIKVIYKPTPIVSTPSPLLESTNSLLDSTIEIVKPVEEKVESPAKTKIVIVEDHFQTSLLKDVDSKQVELPPTISISTPPYTPPPTPNVRDSRMIVEEMFEDKFAESNNDLITTEENLNVRTESPMTSDSVTSDEYLQLSKKKSSSTIDDGEKSSDKKKLKSILKKTPPPPKEKSLKDMITDLFPLLAGLIILVIFAKFNRVDYDTVVNMFTSYLLGVCAMYVQMKFNEE
ncbi:MSP domain-containing protein [Naegleria gruberi]|uniref:MSP domain-containing protein n=1 Tax=Naegleria gruberi TaxID=5762 RepID=D2VNE7_NAEGR|nr:MSP domain-containing protein [Naegleria gruberi]EFC41646.1 MSP domain-containing protein [Naegleria gruberi]|eukprot:XP_002674390.1 MSP domain-containing protein [Naegleria gruberi strain NEG-M]